VTGFPHIQVSPGALQAEANPLGSAARLVDVANTGSSPLEWSLAISPTVSWLETDVFSGTVAPLQSQPLQVSFSAPDQVGVFTTTLLITSNDAITPLVSLPVTLAVTDACVAVAGLDFGYDPAAPRMGQVITFTAELQQGSLPVIFTWDFGDGSLPPSGADLLQIAHLYPATPQSQSYTAALRAHNACSISVQEQKLALAPWGLYLPWLEGPP